MEYKFPPYQSVNWFVIEGSNVKTVFIVNNFFEIVLYVIIISWGFSRAIQGVRTEGIKIEIILSFWLKWFVFLLFILNTK